MKDETMKLAITAQGEKPADAVDLRFGRTRYLIVVNTKTGDCTAHDNAVNLNAAQGAGIQTARNATELGVEAVITGNVGPNAFKTLNAAGIKIYLAGQQTVQDAVELFKKGELKEVSGANVEGHWA